MKAGTGNTFETDHERIAVAGCASYFYLLDDMVKFKGHSQSFTCGWTAAARGERGVERLPGDDMVRRDRAAPIAIQSGKSR